MGGRKTSRGAAKEYRQDDFSFTLAGFVIFIRFSRLTPWAVFGHCSTAISTLIPKRGTILRYAPLKNCLLKVLYSHVE